ncbi:serine hydrolase [Sutcliffiella horikoshii]|uniref:Serine hydrolase n=1 Tax=Sutcliffiella horikoshii TaxID=79883 RepID=A0A5D4SZG6_9BACI|nr:serine hydrolase [Sutcliffiella horikoshii]TYS68693.1 serine hydrolase [Sutcliffiella horikoshii]
MMGTETRLLELKERVQAVVDSTAGHVSFMLEDNCGQLLEKDCDVPKKAASLIKIPLLMAALKQVEAGNINLSDRMNIESESRVGGAGVIQYLDQDTSFTLCDFLTLMITVSDNSATNKVIDLIGIDSVNKFCTEQGLSNTILERKMMDVKASDAGLENRTCARDIVACLKILLDPKSNVLNVESKQLMMSMLRGQQLLDKLPFFMNLNTVQVANKTGELPGVEHDCGIVTFGEKSLIMAVLVDNLIENPSGKRAIQKIGRIIEEYLKGS